MRSLQHATSHSVMFHHFHDDTHPVSQGSLSAEGFDEVLSWLSKTFNLISARTYCEKFNKGKLDKQDICLSFDDALLCQFDVAEPVLKDRNLDAFFFIYSSPFKGTPDFLEIFRYFRTICFQDINDFYDLAFNAIKQRDPKRYDAEQNRFKSLNYLDGFSFYSHEDKWFRYLRDRVLGKGQYEKIMLELMEGRGFDVQEAMPKLWMSDEQVQQLYRVGHMIGLHSYTHPTRLEELPIDEQKIEYSKNMEHLESVLGLGTITSMSHPCGSYCEETLDFLREMGIKIGFRSSLTIPYIKSELEIPREDHANVLRAMQA